MQGTYNHMVVRQDIGLLEHVLCYTTTGEPAVYADKDTADGRCAELHAHYQGFANFRVISFQVL